MIGNFWTHIILSNLRPGNSTGRAIPKGFLFEYVSCPNYFLEITEWVIFFFLTQTMTALIFAILGGGQMWIW
jgi:very-long-chain enoyl-CoA reductase